MTPFSPLPTGRRPRAAALAVAFALGACTAAPPAEPPAPVQIVDGKAALYAPDPGLDPSFPPAGWFRSPPDRRDGFSNVTFGNVHVLRVDSPPGPVLGRQVRLPLSGLPLMRWTWYLEPALFAGDAEGGAARGLRLMLGFKGGAVGQSMFRGVFGTGRPSGFPEFDRMIEIAWGGAAAPRADLAVQRLVATTPQGQRRELRAGEIGAAGAWRAEAADLPELYASFWPNDRFAEVELVFFALGSLPAKISAPPPQQGFLLELLLTP